MLKYTLAGLMLASCSDGPPHTPETRPVEHPNAGNTAIYDVDADDPYEMGDSSFLDLYPGMPLPATDALAPAGEVSVQETTFDRYWLMGEREDTLAYVLVDRPNRTISSIHVVSPDVATRAGLRVSNSFDEIRQRTGATKVVKDPEGQPLLRGDGWIHYRLTYSTGNEADTIPSESTVSEIILRHR
ncbi:hypothetical protein GGR26_000864 [Lewinella marina]|uniref:Uncharacterized protein n=1 Tax=Neolewinella marina TaxID=438751 RepID=A0A2G0CID4_9BACT|nr:hypothetical protein [Neolewinella marina]NJB85119.1 hypothetical protein [Neolewinella marina]PHK99744.1 hypothetical protein CGL56_01460 [Neolewinella marina]